MTSSAGLVLPIVVKGYPRLSETFIAQEILELERLGFSVEIWSLRHPTDGAVHAMHRAIRAPLRYLPEYLHQGAGRVLAGLWHGLRQPGLGRFLRACAADLRRDFTPNRARRIGQALVYARECPAAARHSYVHYLHTPCSVVRYAALLTGGSYSFSAHAKDIWTSEDWEKREKIADAVFGVTCTKAGLAELQRLSPPDDPQRVALVYHGLNLDRFPAPPQRPLRDGAQADDPLRIVTVGRAVAKKGFDDLFQALALLPATLHWRLTHIGTGELRSQLKALAETLGIAERITFAGARPQDEVIDALRAADLFVLPCKEGDAGDRDGLPNVVMEAATQGLAILSTDFAGVPEFITEGEHGRLVPPRDPAALARVMAELAGDPAQRRRLGDAAAERVRTAFSFQSGVADLAGRLRVAMGAPT